MSDEGTTVVLHGKTTPLVLTELGPKLSEIDVARFEKRLGHKLPPAYREFLLKYNGGDPVSGEILGRDDDPNAPYEHGDAVRVLYKLPTPEQGVADYETLVAPREHAWELPSDLLPIGDDAGGNAFVLELGSRGCAVRFLNHERLDKPPSEHRVLANDFLDFALRFRSVDEMREIDAAARRAERTALEVGPLPPRLEAQCKYVEGRFPTVRVWLRAACLKVFDAKGHFSLHADDDSMTVFDTFAWLTYLADGEAPQDPEDACARLAATWFAGGTGNFGLRGYAPGFVEDWWKHRVEKGHFERGADGVRLTTAATERLVRHLHALAEALVSNARG
jgi:hypothetical protein